MGTLNRFLKGGDRYSLVTYNTIILMMEVTNAAILVSSITENMS